MRLVVALALLAVLLLVVDLSLATWRWTVRK